MSFKRLKFTYLSPVMATDEDTGEQFQDYEELTRVIPVTPIKVFQVTEASTTFANILNKVKSDEQIMETLTVALGLTSDEFIDKETGELIGELKERSLANWGQTLEFLLNELPVEITELISIVSNVDYDILKALELDQLFELLEAVVEVNKVDKLTMAAKSFFTAVTKKTDKAVQKAKADGKLKAVPENTRNGRK